VRQLQGGLLSTPYFSQVDVRQRRDQSRGLQVPLQIDMVPRRPRAYEVGVGYGTDTGVRGSLEARFRRLNRRGHNASFKIEVASEISRSFSAQYRFPPIYPRTAAYTLSAGVGDFSPTWSSSLAAKAGVHRSQNRFGLQEVLSVSFEATSFEIGQQEGNARLVIPSASWTYTRSDDPVVTTRGGRVSLLLKGSSDAALSTASFFQFLLDGKIVRGLGRRFRILSRAQLGKTFTSEFQELPPAIRFVTGGDQTVRGYGYESLGPTDVNGDVAGGNTLVTSSFEFEYRPLTKLGFATFFDVGNALDSFSDLSLELGAGIGFRWATPVGYVRLDVAQPLTLADKGPRLHFTIGPDF
jgi:translocation and assembly module TamA